MNISSLRVLVTGASGGIGRAVAAELLRRGASVLLVGRDGDALQSAVAGLGGRSERLDFVAGDLTSEIDRAGVCRSAVAWRGNGINALVNNAGIAGFGTFEETSDAELAAMFAINAAAPMQLCRALLPHLRQQPAATILNVGSVFGSIGYPGFAAYSATKFALRGFTEALRRELADTTVRVQYLAPRATRTAMNPVAVERMNLTLGVAMDAPERVARAACDMLEQGRRDAVIGWPEKLFVRINALWPRVVDGSLRKQLPVIRRYASGAGAAPQTTSAVVVPSRITPQEIAP